MLLPNQKTALILNERHEIKQSFELWGSVLFTFMFAFAKNGHSYAVLAQLACEL
jgi:hypothetical protein